MKQVSFSVTQFLVAMSTAAGASGLPGQNAPPSVEAGLRSGRVSVIAPPLRAAAESVWDPANSRKPATLTAAQVSQCDRAQLSHTLYRVQNLCTFCLYDGSCRLWSVVRLVSVVSLHRQLWRRVSEPQPILPDATLFGHETPEQDL